MIVAAPDPLKILSQPEIAESRILDEFTVTEEEISHVLEEGVWMTSTPPDEEKNDLGVRYFRYQFLFKADLRVALDSNHLRVRFSIRKNTKQKRVSFFSGLRPNPASVVASLYVGQQVRVNTLSANDRDGLIFRKFIDLTKEFDNAKLRNAFPTSELPALSDRDLFGTIEVTKIVKVGDFKKTGKNIILAQREVSSLNQVSNSNSFKKNYEIVISNGIDPAQTTLPTVDESPADPRKRGTFVTPSLATDKEIVDGAMFQMRKSVTQSSVRTAPRVNLDGFNKTDGVAVNVKITNRVRLMSVIVDIPIRDIGRGGKFFITLDVMSLKKNTIGQTLEMEINHSQNIDDYYVPRDIVRLRASSSFASNAHFFVGNIVKTDKNIKGAQIYKRVLSETSPYARSMFVKTSQFMFSNQAQRKLTSQSTLPIFSRKSRRVDTRSTARVNITRALTIGRRGGVYGNFSSSVAKVGPFISYAGNIYTTSTESGVQITSKNLCLGVSGFCFLKRDITKNQSRFEKVSPNGGAIFDLNDPSVDEGLTRPYAHAYNSRSTNMAVLDLDVKDGHLYEYKIKLYLESGVSKTSSTSRIHFHKTPMKAITSRVSGIEHAIVTSNRSTINSEFPSASTSATVRFKINYSIAGNDTSDLLKILSASGLSSLYGGEINAVKGTLRSLISFQIERYNELTGETFYLGTTSEGLFIDDGVSTPGPAPAPGQKYIYRIIPLLISPAEVSVEIARLVSPQLIPNISVTTALADPSSLTSMRSSNLAATSADFNKNTAVGDFQRSIIDKSYSSKALGRGSLRSMSTVPIGSSLGIGSSFMTRYSTGDHFDIFVNTGYGNIATIPGKITSGGHGGAIVRWSLAPQSSYSSQNLDYFVVIAKKQGKRYIAGNCHVGPMTSFKFIDFTNTEFIGVIDYAVVPIYLDGRSGSETTIGRVRQMDRNTKFKRGR